MTTLRLSANATPHLRACARYREKNRKRQFAVPLELGCVKCGLLKPVREFARDSGDKRGFRRECKDCQHQSDAIRYRSERHLYLDYQRDYRKRYPDKVRECKRVAKMKRRRVDPLYRLENNLRGRIQKALRGTVKSDATLQLLGCSVTALKEHLSAQFQTGMTWDNYGSYWVVDHKTPCAQFDLSNRTEQLRCFNWGNLQPLTKDDNRRKGASI